MPQAWRILDFLVNYPESAHMLTWLLDEPGIPTDYRHMEGAPIGFAHLAIVYDRGSRSVINRATRLHVSLPMRAVVSS